MTFRWLLCFLLLFANGSASASAGPRISAISVKNDTFPTMAAHYPGGIEAVGHVEFANYSGYRPLLLDLYLHSDRARSPARPLVIWIHGGGWNRGDARQSGAFSDWPAVLATLAARGFVVASIDYRLSGEAKFPAQIEDVKAAIRFLRSKAHEFGVDPRRVYLWGGSAGGHLAALAAVTCGVATFAPPASTGRLTREEARLAKPIDQSDCVQGAALWYGIFNLAPAPDQVGAALLKKNGSGLLGCDPSACSDVAAKASPITYVRRDLPPLLLIHGTADTEASIEQSRVMVERLRQTGDRVEFLPIEGVNHGFIGKTLEQTRKASLEALDRTFSFFDELARR